MVRPYIRDFRPVLVAVDGGADALLEVGLKPDVIVGDFDSVSDAALGTGAELVVHGYADGRAPGAERLKALGLEQVVVAAPGISEDLALAARAREGGRADRRRRHALRPRRVPRAQPRRAWPRRSSRGCGSASSLVDAKGVSRLVSRRVDVWPLVVFGLVGVAALVATVLASPSLRNVIESMGRTLGDALGL